jgi:hypothetical protein
MKLRYPRLAIAASAALLGGSLYAWAQFTTPPKVSSIGPNDLVQIIPGGNPAPGNVYAPAQWLGGTILYQYSVPLTGFSIQVNPGVKRLLLNPAGTLATGTVLMPVLPISDGQEFCIESTQTQTALTVTAATGTTLTGTAVTALVANTAVCWVYLSPLATWLRYA